MPAPAATFRVLRNARLSLPPATSHSPPVAVHANRGSDPGGKANTPGTAVQPTEHVSVRLCPAVKRPAASRYRSTMPVPPESVIVLLLVTEYTVLPRRTLQGVALAQFKPAVNTVGDVCTSPRSPSCAAI